jgi:hypothetical protein
MRYWKAAWLVVAMSAASGAQANLETEPWLESPWLEHPWLERGSTLDEKKAPCSVTRDWSFDLPPCPPPRSAVQDQRDQFGEIGSSKLFDRREPKDLPPGPVIHSR